MLNALRLGLPTVAVLLAAAALPCRAADAPTEEQALVHVHEVLTLADHDYDGHRLRAMKAVEAACQEMHLDPRGDHHNLPGQRNSDDLMHEAERELQDVHRVADQRHQGAVVSDVEDALREIHVALHMK